MSKTAAPDPRLYKLRRLQQYWTREKIYSRHGETLAQFIARCDLGLVPGFEWGFELEEIWDEER